MKSLVKLCIALVLSPAALVAAQNAAAPDTNGPAAFSELQDLVTDVPAFASFNVSKSASAEPGTVCCTDSATCSKVREEGFGVLGVQPAELPAYGSALAAFRTATVGQWYMTFPNGAALTDGSVGSMFITRKSIIGAYQFKIESMSALATWNAEPSANLPKAGSGKMGMNKVCFAPNRVEIFVSGHKLALDATPRPTTIQPSPNTGTDKPVLRNGYLISTDYGQYMASSDGK